MTLLHTLSSPSRFHDVRFHKPNDSSEAMLVACEDGKVRVFVEPEGKSGEQSLESVAELVGHTKRQVPPWSHTPSLFITLSTLLGPF
jgi:protein MAK11